MFLYFLPDLTFFKPGVWKPGVSGTLIVVVVIIIVAVVLVVIM